MKFTTKIIHQIVKVSKVDSFFAWVGQYISILNKFIPLPQEYEAAEYRITKRNGVYYHLNISDYMQWSVFANLPDYSWQYASKTKQEGVVVLDVGANAGQFCLRLANQLKQNISAFQVHAFEPNQEIFNLLKNNLALNRNMDNFVHLHDIALADEEGEKYFSFNKKNSGGGAITEITSERKVNVTTLDKWFAGQTLKQIDFIKIDVEGFEPQVLLGGSKIIHRFKPDLYLEMTDEWFKGNGYSADWVFNFLHSIGYICWIDDNGKLKNVSHFNMPYKQFNILASTKTLPA